VNTARAAILAGIRRSLGRAELAADRQAELRARIAHHQRNLVPARAAALDHAAQLELFVAMAEAAQATVARLRSSEELPEAVVRYLADENLPAELVVAPDPDLDTIRWDLRPLLRIRRGRAESGDMVSLTPCSAAIAETGTVMLASGPASPTTLNFLPDTHMVVIHADQIVASYEDGWERLRMIAAAREPGPHGLPRTVNFITGPSRTGDIEQQIVLGAHGPRRLHILLVENRRA
jgi:L-lactate dehydrogenase complex protein LldG